MAMELDLRGLTCPEPLIRTKKALDENRDVIVDVIVDNAAARDNILRFAKYRKLEAFRLAECADNIQIRILKGKPAKEPAPTTAAPPAVKKGTVLFIRSDGIGNANPELARKLMANLLRALTETSERPARIVLMNSGVALACHGSECLESLGRLETLGVQLMVCGFCLNYLKLRDRLAVGLVSNMYEIAETFLAAGNVVTV
jgi:selenium metabolism protein YedF